jgi:hypothetical protein
MDLMEALASAFRAKFGEQLDDFITSLNQYLGADSTPEAANPAEKYLRWLAQISCVARHEEMDLKIFLPDTMATTIKDVLKHQQSLITAFEHIGAWLCSLKETGAADVACEAIQTWLAETELVLQEPTRIGVSQMAVGVIKGIRGRALTQATTQLVDKVSAYSPLIGKVNDIGNSGSLKGILTGKFLRAEAIREPKR